MYFAFGCWGRTRQTEHLVCDSPRHPQLSFPGSHRKPVRAQKEATPRAHRGLEGPAVLSSSPRGYILRRYRGRWTQNSRLASLD